ncbi:MAG: hypothetical protein JOY70_02865 [Acidisphaera sp.]|nr:hypothetical protein [Acidisphaera sp.]
MDVGGPILGLSFRPADIEAELADLRCREPDLRAAARKALTRLAPDLADGTMAAAADALADAMDAAARTRPELPYHDRHHAVEAVLGMGWLVAIAERRGWVGRTAAASGIVAMVGHDLLHDGMPPDCGSMELRSAAAVHEALQRHDLPEPVPAVIRAVILGTDPCEVRSNAMRASGIVPAGPLGREVDVVTAIANDADVFASLLPSLGWTLTDALARERQSAGIANAGELRSFSSRLQFLRSYERPTDASELLGVGTLVRQQIGAFCCFGSDPDSGAARLDAMPRESAMSRYQAALAWVAAERKPSLPRGAGRGFRENPPRGFGADSGDAREKSWHDRAVEIASD